MTITMRGGALACPLFDGLSPDTERRLRHSVHEVGFRKGETIFLHESPAQTCFMVLDGWVKLYRVASSGMEVIVRVQGANETVGFCGGLRSPVQQYGAEAATVCRLLAIPTSTIRRLVLDDPEFGRRLLGHSTMLLEQMLDHVEALKTQTAAQRVAAFLLEHGRRKGTGLVVELPFEKILVAGVLGMQPESLSRVLKRLAAIGVRQTPTRIHVMQPALLEDLLRDDRAEAMPRRRLSANALGAA